MARSNNGAKPKSSTSNDFSLLQWAALFGVIVFLFIFPFHVGLFNGFDLSFEASLYEASIFAYVLLLMMGILLFWHWRPTSLRSWLAVMIMAMPLCYWISAQQAVSKYNAGLMVLLTFMLATFYIVGLYLAKDKLSSSILEATIQTAAYMIVIFGILNLFGQVYFPEALWLAHNGYRLASVFQYSNSYVGFLIAALLGCAYFVIRSRTWHWQGLHALMLVPIIISFILTYSRGGIVMLPIAVLLILPFLTMARQLLLLGHLAISGVLSIAILGKITQNTEQIAQMVQPNASKPATVISAWNGLPLESWLLLIGASVVTAVLSVLLQSKLSSWITGKTQRLQGRKGSAIFVPAAILGAGILGFVLLLATNGFKGILPDSISERLASINFQQHSVLERQTFYSDALEISQDYPVIGAGGGAWKALYQMYQNNPYSSEQAHSYLFQTLVEIGWFGLIVLLAIFSITLYWFIRLQRQPENKERQLYFYVIAASLLTHSVIDFDMNYMYIAAIVFLSLGAMVAPYEHSFKASWLHKKQEASRYVYPALLCIGAIAAIFSAQREYEANRNFEHMAYLLREKQATFEEISPYLDNINELSPKNPAFNLTRAELMSQVYHSTGDPKFLEDAKKSLERAQLYDPYNRLIILAEYRNMKDRGELARVPSYLEDNLAKFQWDIKSYELAIIEYVEIGKLERQTAPAASEAKWNRALEIYNEVLERQKELENLPEGQLQGRSFSTTIGMAQAIGQIYYHRGEYEKALSMFEIHRDSERPEDPNINPAVDHWRINLRFYIATLQALGRWDEEQYQRLIVVDPNEEQLIRELQP
ncbi:hypothetical protein DNH61_07640 [Paenibacillus sambharensis]|uniref:O-antigen ligase-related domain-containing protein n=1 Tax=Paenibacillus sambharensis TaxID=1803190 RepID=A0A2W1LXY2_9BACL|nr:O-antigen ligase family protein [Paenibacillus sambharensis]PZD96377.1 hypothetical protein DNH61_07640 [Paenibacillus sambharensis]